jgi:serine/threonine protein kinase
MLCGTPPFFSGDKTKTFMLIQYREPEFDEAIFSKSAFDLISNLLEKDLSKRLINPSNIMDHDFFHEIEW